MIITLATSQNKKKKKPKPITGILMPKFQLQNMISTYTRDFSREKWPQIVRF
jgi:hypothetical protein